MTIFRPRPILAICGAACLIAFTPYCAPPARRARALDQVAGGARGAPVHASPPPNATDADDGQAAQLSDPGERVRYSRVNKVAPFASADPNALYQPPQPEASVERR